MAKAIILMLSVILWKSQYFPETFFFFKKKKTLFKTNSPEIIDCLYFSSFLSSLLFGFAKSKTVVQ